MYIMNIQQEIIPIPCAIFYPLRFIVIILTILAGVVTVVKILFLFLGASEEIRTLGPNLGKVVLYP